MLRLVAQRVEPDDDVVLIDTLDGYLTALACGPVHADPLQAMDALFGEDWAVVLDEQDATERFMEALHQRWTEIGDALAPELLERDREQMQLMPLITVFDEAAKAELVSQGVMLFEESGMPPEEGVLWVQGFLRAVHDLEQDWRRFAPESSLCHELDSMLLGITAVVMPPGEELDRYLDQAYEPDDAVDSSILLDDALFCVQDLKLFWQRPETRQLLS